MMGNETAAIESLMAWVSVQKLVVEGEPIFAFHDPPWTPDFLRRNEVLIRIVKNHARPELR